MTAAHVPVPDGDGVDVDTIEAEHDRLLHHFPDQGYDWRTPVYALLDQIPALIAEVRHLRAALASQPAQTVTDEAVQAGAKDMYERDWASDDPWEEVDHSIRATYTAITRQALTAALPHLTPALSGDGVAEASAAERAWDEGHAASDCECGHSIVAHPSDNYRHCVREKDCGCGGYEPARNPYRIAREGVTG